MILYYLIFYVIQVIHRIALSRELEHIEKSFENLIFKKNTFLGMILMKS